MGANNTGQAKQKDSLGQRWKTLLRIVFVLVLLAAAGIALWYYLRSRHYVSTDDAFIDATIVQVSPQVAGQVLRVYVEDNQAVEENDLLAEIDPSNYEVALRARQAAARLAEAKLQAAQVGAGMKKTTTTATLGQAQASLDAAKNAQIQAQAALAAAEAEAKRAKLDFRRYSRLEEIAVSRQKRDQAEAAYRVAEAKVKEAREQFAAAKARVVSAQNELESAKTAPQQVQVSQSQVEQSRAQLDQAQAAVQAAELDLEHTKIYAPISGVVTKKNVDPGDFFQIGQTMMALVSKDMWVTANFKETQLTHMRVGQTAKVHVDAYPRLVLHGRVQSIQEGSGSRFSLLPPENATGNFVKVVQRVPVKIVFDEQPPARYHLGPGMSVVPKVRVR